MENEKRLLLEKSVLLKGQAPPTPETSNHDYRQHRTRHWRSTGLVSRQRLYVVPAQT